MVNLVHAFPQLGALPVYPIGTYPTPVETAPALAESARVAEVWVKREDLSAEPLGGNKVRRLELFLGEALARRARGVWTYGATGSNHLLATAVYGRRAGLEVHVRYYNMPAPEVLARNRKRVEALATRVDTGATWSAPLEAAWRRLGYRLRSREGLYPIPAGGTSALGILGSIGAGLELAGQVRAGDMPRPDALVVPVGTGGTLVGLALGLELAELAVPVVGVRVVPRLVVNRWWLGHLARAAGRLLRRHGVPAPRRLRRSTIRLAHDQIGAGYGCPTAAADTAVALARAAGLELEPVYSGKALAALLEAGRTWVGERGRLLFVHTFDGSPKALPGAEP